MKSAKKGLDKKESRMNTGQHRRKRTMGQGLVNGLKLGKDGIYRYRIMVKGQVYTGSTDESDEKQAENALVIIKADLLKADKGTLVKKAPTLAKALEIWKTNKLGHVTDRYITNCSRAIERYFIPSLGTKLIDAIELSDIKGCLQAYILKTQKNKEVKNMGGYNQLLTYLHSLFLEMKDCKYIRAYKDIIPEYADNQAKKKRVVDEEDFDKVIAAVDKRFSFDNQVAVRMGLYLGLRSIEISKAKWSCINWNDKEFTNIDTKGNEAEPIPICDEMFNSLQKLKKLRENASGEPVSPFAYLLPMPDGRMKRARFFRYALDKGALDALGSTLSSHDLRRSFITTLHKNGVPLDTIRRLARHSDIQTTMEYIQVCQNEKATAISNVFNKKRA